MANEEKAKESSEIVDDIDLLLQSDEAQKLIKEKLTWLSNLTRIHNEALAKSSTIICIKSAAKDIAYKLSDNHEYSNDKMVALIKRLRILLHASLCKIDHKEMADFRNATVEYPNFAAV